MNQKHQKYCYIFMCEHQRNAGRSCGKSVGVHSLYEYCRRVINQINASLAPEKIVKVSKTSCLGQCRFGPNLVIFPENVWYRYQNSDDIDAIIQSHIMQRTIVTHLQTKHAIGDDS